MFGFHFRTCNVDHTFSHTYILGNSPKTIHKQVVYQLPPAADSLKDSLVLLFFVIDFSLLNSARILTGDVALDTFCLNPEQKSCSNRSMFRLICQLIQSEICLLGKFIGLINPISEQIFPKRIHSLKAVGQNHSHYKNTRQRFC